MLLLVRLLFDQINLKHYHIIAHFIHKVAAREICDSRQIFFTLKNAPSVIISFMPCCVITYVRWGISFKEELAVSLDCCIRGWLVGCFGFETIFQSISGRA